uniref:Uncharacterized protein n=1 Tax=Chrysotila carterae TaxID=13221 RepID=A0A6S9V854_CHRCT
MKLDAAAAVLACPLQTLLSKTSEAGAATAAAAAAAAAAEAAEAETAAAAAAAEAAALKASEEEALKLAAESKVETETEAAVADAADTAAADAQSTTEVRASRSYAVLAVARRRQSRLQSNDIACHVTWWHERRMRCARVSACVCILTFENHSTVCAKSVVSSLLPVAVYAYLGRHWALVSLAASNVESPPSFRVETGIDSSSPSGRDASISLACFHSSRATIL